MQTRDHIHCSLVCSGHILYCSKIRKNVTENRQTDQQTDNRQSKQLQRPLLLSMDLRVKWANTTHKNVLQAINKVDISHTLHISYALNTPYALHTLYISDTLNVIHTLHTTHRMHFT